MIAGTSGWACAGTSWYQTRSLMSSRSQPWRRCPLPGLFLASETGRNTGSKREESLVHDLLIGLAAIGIVGYVIGRQLLGEPLRGKRLVVLPVVLTVIGALSLGGHHATPTDAAFIALSGLVAAGIGFAQGRLVRLESREGVLWSQLPPRGLWLWLGLVVSRLTIDVVASGAHAHLAASTTPILLVLGINRLTQAAIVAPRAWSAGIPFAPERDGSTFLADAFAARPPASRERAPHAGTKDVDWRGILGHVGNYVEDRRR